MKLALRRFPDRVVRVRRDPGSYNERGRFVEGARREANLFASVQPILVEDKDFVGGAQYSERRKIFVPSPATLRAATDICVAGLARGEIIAGLVRGDIISSAYAAVLAADPTIEQVALVADEIVIAPDGTFVVEESQIWPAYTRATILRET